MHFTVHEGERRGYFSNAFLTPGWAAVLTCFHDRYAPNLYRHRLPMQLYDDFPSLTSFSCSMICLLQLFHVSSRPSHEAHHQDNILSTWVETPWLWELCADLSLGADGPDESGDGEDGRQHNSSIDLPVLRLCVPATSRRPDVLWISVVGLAVEGRLTSPCCAAGRVVDIRNFCAATLQPVSILT